MIPYRQNVATPIGVTFTEMKKIISTPVGMYPLDNYIRWENFPKPKNFKKSQNMTKDLLPALYLTSTIGNTKRDGSGQMRMTPRKLFGTSAKTNKADGSEAEVRVIYLQPAKQSDKAIPKKAAAKYESDFAELCECVGIFPPINPIGRRNPNTCPFAGECGKVCLVGSGQLGKEDAEFAGWCKTWLWFHYPLVFLRQLLKEIKKESKRSKDYGTEFFARLNGTSDITWEKFIDMDALVEDTAGFGGFYDYTKYPWKGRKSAGKWIDGKQPEHYDLTFSISEKEEVTGKDGLGDAIDWLANGGRVAVVVDQWKRYPYDRTPQGKTKGEKGTTIVYEKTNAGVVEKNKWAITDYSDLRNGAINAPDWSPNSQKGKYPLIVDGDETDFRFNDPPSSIVILKPKGLGTREDGKYYVNASIYTGGKAQVIDGKAKGFIKSKDFILALQDEILSLIGGEPQAAKNPRKSKVQVMKEGQFYYVVLNNQSMLVNGKQRFGTLQAVKNALAVDGYKVVGKGKVKYVVPR